MEILKEARSIIRTHPMDLKVGHLKQCCDALEQAYFDMRVSLTRETATNFVAHLTRTVSTLDLFRPVPADKPPSNLVTVEGN